eukprot:5889482-Pyramimonas_sp.AAC.1
MFRHAQRAVCPLGDRSGYRSWHADSQGGFSSRGCPSRPARAPRLRWRPQEASFVPHVASSWQQLD